MDTLIKVWELLVAAWREVNYWARWALVFVVVSPFVLVLAALFGSPPIVLAFTFALFLVVPGLIFAELDPGIVALVAVFGGRKPLLWVLAIIAGEMLWGIYLYLFPVKNDPALVFLAMLLLITGLLVKLSWSGKVGRLTSNLLFLGVVAIASLHLFGGRVEVERKFQEYQSRIQQPGEESTRAPKPVPKPTDPHRRSHPAPPVAPQRPAEPETYEVIRDTDAREKPSMLAKRVGWFGNGETVTVMGSTGDWLEVAFKHGNPPRGFIRRDDAMFIERTN